jgi:hypothetical protein
LLSESLSLLRQWTILEPSLQDGKDGLPESSWKQLLRCHASRDCFSLSAMMSPQLARSFLYALCQQFFGPVTLFRAFSSSFTPRGSLAPSMAKSATAPSSSIIGARSLAVDEKMFHEKQLVLRGKLHRHVKISSTAHRFLVMMQLATDELAHRQEVNLSSRNLGLFAVPGRKNKEIIRTRSFGANCCTQKRSKSKTPKLMIRRRSFYQLFHTKNDENPSQ